MKLSNFLLVKMGDEGWSRREQTLIASSLDAEQLDRAYRLGVDQLGFDVLEVTLSSSNLEAKYIDALGDSGFPITEEFMKEDVLSSDDLFQIFMHTVSMGNHGFAWAGLDYGSVDIGPTSTLDVIH